MQELLRNVPGLTALASDNQKLSPAQFLSYLEKQASARLGDYGPPGHVAEADIRRATFVSLAEVVYDLLMAGHTTEKLLNEEFKRVADVLNPATSAIEALKVQVDQLRSELQNLRVYSEATRRMPAFASTLALQDTLEDLRRVDAMQANALNEIRRSVDDLEAQVEGDSEQPTDENLFNRVVALEGRVEDVEDDMRQVCEECFEGEDSSGQDTLLRRIEKLEDGEDEDPESDEAVFGDEEEEDGEEDEETPVNLPASLQPLFIDLFKSDPTAEALVTTPTLPSIDFGRPVFTPYGTVRRFPHPVDQRGQFGKPRPPINEPVPAAVAREDMINHPDTVYALVDAPNLKYRFHDGAFQIKFSSSGQFSSGYNDFQDQGDEALPTALRIGRTYYRVDTAAPLDQSVPNFGEVVGFDRALAHMRTNPTAVYGNMQNSRVYRMVGGVLKVLSLVGDFWTPADLHGQLSKGYEAKWRRLNDADGLTGNESRTLQSRLDLFLTPKPVNTVKVSISADTHGRPKPGATVSWEEARVDMLDHPEARYGCTAGEGVIYRINNCKIEYRSTGSMLGALGLLGWQDSCYNRGGNPDSVKWIRQSDEPGTAIVIARASIGENVSFDAALADMKSHPEARYSPVGHGDSKFTYRFHNGRLESNGSTFYSGGGFSVSTYHGRKVPSEVMLVQWKRLADDASTLGRSLPNVRR